MVAGGERRRGRNIRVVPEARLARQRSTPEFAQGWRGAEANTGMVGRGGRGGVADHWSGRGARRREGGGPFESFGAAEGEAEEHSRASAPGSGAACGRVG
jgi:hypothetical protein